MPSLRTRIDSASALVFFATCLLAGLGLERLLDAGPFRFSRNPSYVGELLILGALAALCNSAWVPAFVPVLALAFDRLVIPGEEARLGRVFGERWTEYCGRVRRWL